MLADRMAKERKPLQLRPLVRCSTVHKVVLQRVPLLLLVSLRRELVAGRTMMLEIEMGTGIH